MIIRSLFSLGLVALIEVLTVFIPAPLLPREQVWGFFSAEIDDALAVSDLLEYDMPEDFGGSIAVWNDSDAWLFSASVSWESGDQGTQLADGSPIGRYESFVFDPVLAGVQQISVSVQTDSGEISGVFTHDFSAAPLALAVCTGEMGKPVLTLPKNQQ